MKNPPTKERYDRSTWRLDGKKCGEAPRGRPVNDLAQMAFENLCEQLEILCASEKLYTLDDLYSLMLS